MEIKKGADIRGLDINMRPVLIEAEEIWKRYGRPEGVTITAGLDGLHSAGSLHYYGRALDFRTRCFTAENRAAVYRELVEALSSKEQNYDVVKHPTHIHVEYDV